MTQARTVIEILTETLARRDSAPDESQLAAAARLEQFRSDWIDYKARRANAVTRLLVRPPIPRGVYLWGGVGRGKSLLMDCLYVSLPVVRKVRVHFHEFMRTAHAEMSAVQGSADPLDVVGLRIARRWRLICFDEFHVSDIADAMILHRLLVRLIGLRVGFVMTSNYPPAGLYPEGLHRDRILPAIELLEGSLDVVALEHGIDYRLRALERLETFYLGTGAPGDAHLMRVFDSLAECGDENPVLNIEAREIRARRRAGGLVWFEFAVLCGGPRSHSDYLEIAAQFHTVLLSNLPRMSAGQSSEARRFTWLVDILYDNRVKLVVSAEVAPQELYVAGALSQEFARTSSRLIEMQSREYAALAPRRGGAMPTV